MARGGLVVAAVHHELHAAQRAPVRRAGTRVEHARRERSRNATNSAARPRCEAARLVLRAICASRSASAGSWCSRWLFFAIVTTLFPLPSPRSCRGCATSRRVCCGSRALLSSLLALEFLFRDDAQDGTLEQYALSGQSLTWLLFAKTAAHWLLTGLPLALMAPLAALALGVPAAALRGHGRVGGARQLSR